MRILEAASCYVIICRLNALTSSSGGVSGMGFTKMLDLHSSTQITVRNYFTVASQKTQLNVSTPNQDFPYTICQQKYYKCDQRKKCCLLTTRLQGSARNYSESETYHHFCTKTAKCYGLSRAPFRNHTPDPTDGFFFVFAPRQNF
jgi:hypothetical protein